MGFSVGMKNNDGYFYTHFNPIASLCYSIGLLFKFDNILTIDNDMLVLKGTFVPTFFLWRLTAVLFFLLLSSWLKMKSGILMF